MSDGTRRHEKDFPRHTSGTLALRMARGTRVAPQTLGPPRLRSATKPHVTPEILRRLPPDGPRYHPTLFPFATAAYTNR